MLLRCAFLNEAKISLLLTESGRRQYGGGGERVFLPTGSGKRGICIRGWGYSCCSVALLVLYGTLIQYINIEYR